MCCKYNERNLIDIVQTATAITHSNEMSVNGAILQALAIKKIVKIQQTNGKFDIQQYLSDLAGIIQKFESNKNETFCQQIENIELLLKTQDPSEEKVVNVLGHSYQALYSVPTAIYCFLRTVKYGDEVKNSYFILKCRKLK